MSMVAELYERKHQRVQIIRIDGEDLYNLHILNPETSK